MGSASSGLAGVVIYVKDLARAAEFYSAVLGVDAVDRHDEFVVLSASATELSLVAMPPQIADTVVITEPPALREESPVKPSFLVRRLAEAAAAAITHGGGAKPLDAAWEFRGLRHLDGFDPEGNVIQLVERIDARDA